MLLCAKPPRSVGGASEEPEFLSGSGEIAPGSEMEVIKKRSFMITICISFLFGEAGTGCVYVGGAPADQACFCVSCKYKRPGLGGNDGLPTRRLHLANKLQNVRFPIHTRQHVCTRTAHPQQGRTHAAPRGTPSAAAPKFQAARRRCVGSAVGARCGPARGLSAPAPPLWPPVPSPRPSSGPRSPARAPSPEPAQLVRSPGPRPPPPVRASPGRK